MYYVYFSFCGQDHPHRFIIIKQMPFTAQTNDVNINCVLATSDQDYRINTLTMFFQVSVAAIKHLLLQF